VSALHPAVLVLALDGESVTASNTGLAIISVVSMVFGYLLLAALWYFVFSNKARERRRRGKGPDG
jgi:peptidoglycan/LPS O-acetylase OafA/YrhL